MCKGYIQPGPTDISAAEEYVPQTEEQMRSTSSSIVEDLRDACRARDVQGIHAVIARCPPGAEIVNAPDHIGRAALHYAVDAGSLECVRALVEICNADVNAIVTCICRAVTLVDLVR